MESLKNLNSLLFSTNNENLCRFIETATNNIRFIGVGISQNMAKQLVQKKHLIEYLLVDNNEFIYKSGYGDINAIELLKENGVNLLVTKNIRVNILNVDNKVVIYTPTPLVIEEEPNINTPSGLVMDLYAVKDIFDSINIVSDKNYENSHSVQEAKVIAKKLPIEEIRKVSTVIDKNPLKFDLERCLNIYKNKIQFIEIELKGFNLKQHKVNIPKELLQFTKRNAVLQEQLSATYTLFNDKNSKLLKKTEEITKMVDKLRKENTISLKRYGVIFPLSRKHDIQGEVRKIKAKVDVLKKDVEVELEDAFEKSKKNIIKLLYPLVKSNPPEKLTKFADKGYKFSREEIEEYIKDKLEKSFKSPKDFTEGMELNVDFKDVTYEMIKSEDFIAAIKSTELKYIFKNEPIITEEIVLPVKNNILE